SAATADVPEGSVLKARISGGILTPKLEWNGQEMPLTLAGKRQYTAEFPLDRNGALRLKQSLRTAGSWQITTRPDAAPEVSLLQAPQPTPQGTLRLSYQAKDDYGIVKLTGTISPAMSLANNMGGEDIVFALPRPPADTPASSLHDFTAHPWA